MDMGTNNTGAYDEPFILSNSGLCKDVRNVTLASSGSYSLVLGLLLPEGVSPFQKALAHCWSLLYREQSGSLSLSQPPP